MWKMRGKGKNKEKTDVGYKRLIGVHKVENREKDINNGARMGGRMETWNSKGTFKEHHVV